MDVLKRVQECGIVPVVVIRDISQAVPAARALLEGGISVMEITFRTEAAPDAIAAVKKAVPEMVVGAGTVVNREQFERALASGAEFIVSPGVTDELLETAAEKEVPFFPGIATPGEVMSCRERGFRTLKFFPAESYGGLKTIKALGGPFSDVKFIPTGGISEKNAGEYLNCGKVAAVGGSWMITADMISDGEFDRIREKAAQAVEIKKKSQNRR